MGNTVAMTEEVVVAIDMVDGTMADGLELAFVAFEEQVATAIAHVNTTTVDIRAVDGTAAPHGYAIVTLSTLTTVVPRDEEVVPTIVTEDERCLDGIRACIVGRRILGRIRIDGQGCLALLGSEVKAAGNRLTLNFELYDYPGLSDAWWCRGGLSGCRPRKSPIRAKAGRRHR